jgi:hypothetical protein
MGGVFSDPGPGGILRAVGEVDWSAYAMPPSEQWYRPDRVPDAFRLLVSASDQEEGWAAYDTILYAVGNNHAGCLYPAAVPAAPLLVRVVREVPGWSRWAALEILIEYLSFEVDREEFVDPAGSVIHARGAIVATVRSIREDLERLALQPATDPTAKSARDLLELMDRPAGGNGHHRDGLSGP